MNAGRPGPIDLFAALRRAGVGPGGAFLVVLFFLEMLHALMTIPATSGADRMREIAFHTLLFALLGAGGAAVVWNETRRKGPTPDERLPTLKGTSGGVAVRVALDESALATIGPSVAGLAALSPPEQLRLVAQAVLSAPHAWASGSLDSLPRMPDDRMTAVARRLVADAERRFPSPDPAAAGGGGTYRAEPWVLVASFVVTSPLTIDAPKAEGREATAAVLRNLVAIAGDATLIDVRVSGAMPAASAGERDPALRSFRG